MKVVFIGGTGHIGTYLVPKLVRGGHQVIQISRSQRFPYKDGAEWEKVENVVIDRDKEERNGTFGEHIASFSPDIVIDNICFSVESAQMLAQALRGKVGHLLVTGSIWVHGYSECVPTPEHASRRPIGEYGINKNAIEEFYLHEFRERKFPATIIHPGHIVGYGWPCLNPQGHFNLQAFQTIIDGEVLKIPNLGLETVHHVHAEDVAQIFEKAIQNPEKSIGEAFHVVSSQAVTLRGYAEAVYSWFGQRPELEFIPLANLEKHLSREDFHQTQEHVMRSPCMSIEKARKLLGFEPHYSSLQACRESVESMIALTRLRVSEQCSK